MSTQAQEPGPALVVNCATGETSHKELSKAEKADWHARVKEAPIHALAALRATRNALLQQSDWSQLPDAQAAMTPAKRAEWTAYRTALRDFPANVPNPLSPPPFPEAPK